MSKFHLCRVDRDRDIRRTRASSIRLLGAMLSAAWVLTPPGVSAAEPVRERVSMNAAWRFVKGDPADAAGQLTFAEMTKAVALTGQCFLNKPPQAPAVKPRPRPNPGGDISYVQSEFDDRGWRQLNLPHDWGVEGRFTQEFPGDTGKLAWWGVGWYRKHFTVSDGEQGRQFYLDIDGAMSCAMVWLNGQFVGGWPYGYASFRLDLTPYIEHDSDNVLAIRLDNPPNSSRWYPGGGIYRNVWLVKTSPVHVGQWGTFVSTPQVSQTAATVEIRASIDNRSPAEAAVTVTTQIDELGADGQTSGAPVGKSPPLKTTIAAHGSAASLMKIDLPNPRLWTLDRPQLYAATTTIEQDGQLADRYPTVFGIRTIRFDAAKGFSLNGQRVAIQGVCDHHDLGPLGAAVNTRALQRQIEILKEMGCNAIRTSHNPPAPELLDLCDRMGMLVMDEAFDCWRQGKTPNDYQRLFGQWHEKDLRPFVRRDRNHPCVILWSIGNEIQEQRIPDGWKLASQLAAIVRGEDTTRPVTAALDDGRSGYNGFQKAIDVFGYNYKPFEYGKFHAAHPKIPLFGSETASCVSSRGEYFFPVSNNKAEGQADFQVSSYDLCAPPWATTPDAEFKGQDENPCTAGEFVWTGFDYLGEPTPYNHDVDKLPTFTDPARKAMAEKELKDRGRIHVPSRSSYFGIVDLCGFKKDRFYLYQARWRPALPMVHILPHWNWPERVGQVTPVHVYTSGDEAELFLNGTSLGRKKKQPYQYRLRWDDVSYSPGELKAVAYKNGATWAEAIVRTTGPAERITLQADRDQLQADGSDLSFVTVTIADKDGLMVPRAKNRIRFRIEGPGEIVAMDNGDATCHESMQSTEHNAYNGLCLVIIRTKAGQAGTITIQAESDGLASAAVRLTIRAK